MKQAMVDSSREVYDSMRVEESKVVLGLGMKLHKKDIWKFINKKNENLKRAKMR